MFWDHNPKNQDRLFEIVFEKLEHQHFPELGNAYFLELEHPHFLELEHPPHSRASTFSRIGASTFYGIGLATLIVGNPTLTLEEFEHFLLKKSSIVVDFFIIYK